MARFGPIDRLPPDVRALIAQRRRVERRTLTAIQHELAGLGFRVARSTLHRHAHKLDAAELAASRAGLAPILTELRAARVALEALCEHLGARKPTI